MGRPRLGWRLMGRSRSSCADASLRVAARCGKGEGDWQVRAPSNFGEAAHMRKSGQSATNVSKWCGGTHRSRTPPSLTTAVPCRGLLSQRPISPTHGRSST